MIHHQGDTAEITAWPNGYDRRPAPEGEIDSVIFKIRRPDETVEALPGEVTDDGAGYLRYDNTDELGGYAWSAQFTMMSGEVRSVSGAFKIVDTFASQLGTHLEQIADEVWMRLEDMFDSDEGGPWLRDVTHRFFDPTKIETFVSEALLQVNNTPPMTEIDLGYFLIQIPNTDPMLIGETTTTPDRYIVVQGTLLAVIRHLIRSYTEIPDVRGANVVFEDRRDYFQRWQMVYQMEEQAFNKTLALWKRQFYSFGKSAVLVHSKAGRLGRGGTQWRARNVGRYY